jgi:hypothetical protein
MLVAVGPWKPRYDIVGQHYIYTGSTAESNALIDIYHQARGDYLS